MSVDWRKHIVSTPDVLSGRPRLAGTRIPVNMILGYLALGYDAARIREELPDVTDEHIAACLGYARDLSTYEVVAS